mgnify:CR=1 FL=1
MCCVSYTQVVFLTSAILIWLQRRDTSWRGVSFKNTSSKQVCEVKQDIFRILSMTIYRKRVSRFPEHCYLTHHPFFFGIWPRIWQSSKFLEMRMHRPECINVLVSPFSFIQCIDIMVTITLDVTISVNLLRTEPH